MMVNSIAASKTKCKCGQLGYDRFSRSYQKSDDGKNLRQHRWKACRI